MYALCKSVLAGRSHKLAFALWSDHNNLKGAIFHWSGTSEIPFVLSHVKTAFGFWHLHLGSLTFTRVTTVATFFVRESPWELVETSRRNTSQISSWLCRFFHVEHCTSTHFAHKHFPKTNAIPPGGYLQWCELALLYLYDEWSGCVLNELSINDDLLIQKTRRGHGPSCSNEVVLSKQYVWQLFSWSAMEGLNNGVQRRTGRRSRGLKSFLFVVVFGVRGNRDFSYQSAHICCIESILASCEPNQSMHPLNRCAIMDDDGLQMWFTFFSIYLCS